GGATVIALLACPAATMAMGRLRWREGKGPLAAVLLSDAAKANGNKARHRAAAERPAEETESAIGELHSLFANITVALVVAHCSGWRSPVSYLEKILCWRLSSLRKRRVRE